MRLAVAVAALVQLVAAANLKPIIRGSSGDIVPSTYIVELEGTTSIKRGFASPHAELYHDLARRGVLWDVTREFSARILTGVTLTLHDDAHIHQLAQASGVLSITPVYIHPPPTPVSSYNPTGPDDPNLPKDTFPPHVMTGVDKLHAEGLLGQGIKVGVIDSGIDYTHPLLGAGFGAGYKVIGGHDFVGDAYRGSSGPAPVPDNDPLDQCNGHGTFTAGVIGANPGNPYNMSGVAYKASINAYRIFGCSGGAPDDIVIAALIRADEDDNDVISLAVSNVGTWTSSLSGVIASRIANKGRVVVASIGNNGAYGAWYAGSPSTGSSVISVGSVDNTAVNIQNATTSSGRTIPYYSFSPLPVPPGLPLYATSSNVSSPADACSALPSTTPNLANYVVVIRRGGCAITDKFANAAKSGARYFLLYDNLNEPFLTLTLGNYTAALISQQDGIFLVQQAIPGKQTISFPNASHAYPILTAGQVSNFSTYGPTNDLFFKPAVTAPGSHIFSTFPVALGSYQIEDGTSASVPYVAGSAALLLQAKGTSAARSVRSILENTALPSRVSATNTSLFETAAHQGAGLVQVYDAVKNMGSMSPAEILLNDTTHFVEWHIITIRNEGRGYVKYNLVHVPAGTANTISGITNNLGPLSLVSNQALVSIFPSTVVLHPGGSAWVWVKFSPPTGLDHKAFPVYSGFIQAQGSDGSTLHSTYLGLAASMKDMRIIDNQSTSNGSQVPLVAGKNGKAITGPTDFSMKNSDVPVVVYRLAAGSHLVRVDLIDARAHLTTNLQHRSTDDRLGKRSIWDWLWPQKGHTLGGTFAAIPTVGALYQGDYVARNAPGAFKTLNVTGFANGTAIPDGSYKILLRALKITGNPKHQGDYEVWASPQINVRSK